MPSAFLSSLWYSSSERMTFYLKQVSCLNLSWSSGLLNLFIWQKYNTITQALFFYEQFLLQTAPPKKTTAASCFSTQILLFYLIALPLVIIWIRKSSAQIFTIAPSSLICSLSVFLWTALTPSSFPPSSDLSIW